MGQIYYWTLFIIPAFVSLWELNIKKSTSKIFTFIFGLILILFIGLRNEVGGDWGSYLRNYYITGLSFDFTSYPVRSDYGYELLSYLSFQLGLPIYIFNSIIALIGVYAIFRFAKKYKQKWLFIAISIPTLITVVHIGFVRQGFATSLAILAFIYLIKEKNIKFILFSLLAISIHKTALFIIIFFLISKFINFKKYKFEILVFSLISIFAFYFLKDQFGNLLTYYIYSDRDILISRGAPMRLITHIIAVLLFLNFRNYMNFSVIENRFLTLYSILVFIAVFFVSNYSTFVDRISIYFLPFQYLLIIKFIQFYYKNYFYNLLKLSVLIFYGIIFFIWLNYSYATVRWIPYKSIISHYESYNLITSAYNRIYADIYENKNDPKKDLLYYDKWEFNREGTHAISSKTKSISFEEYKKLNTRNKRSDREIRNEFLRKKFDNYSDPFNNIRHSN